MPALDLGPSRIVAKVPSVVASRVSVPSSPGVAVVAVAGPQGPRGLSGEGFTHHQVSPAAQWNITHNLGAAREPTVLLDDRPTIPVWADVVHPDLNTTLIILPEPATGWAYL